MIGEKFGRLTVLDAFKERKGSYNITFFKCICDCGREKVIRANDVKNGHTKSCGCFSKQSTRDRSITHGMRGTRFYRMWADIKQRCENENCTQYYKYGARGIQICDRWEKFENFRDDMYESYLEHVAEHGDKNTSLDRINVNQGYSSANCRWATLSLQSFNQRRRSDNVSGVPGVHFDKKSSKWRAQINVNGGNIHLGMFIDFNEAVEARRAAELNYFGFNKEAN